MRAVLLIAALLGVSSAAVLSSFDATKATSLGWRHDGDVCDAHKLTVRISLKRTNIPYLESVVARVSNPQSPDYTQYPTMEEVVAMTAPAPASVEAVRAWLVVTGQHFVEAATGDFVVSTTVGEASKLFHTSFSSMVNDVTSQTAVVGDAVVVPDEIAAHIDTVFGVHGLPLPPREAVKGANVATVTPDVITKTYNISLTASGSKDNRQAIVEFQGQLMSAADLKTFFSRYVSGAKAGDDTVYKYVGDNQQGEGVEANLDVQYIMGVAPGILTEAWQYAGTDFCSDLKRWTQQIISTSNPPNVFSVSYGWQGELSQIGCSTSMVSSIDDDFKTITATGVSIIFASGDSGSGSTGIFTPKLYSSWPASSNYVTAVGATRFIDQTQGDGEQATDQFGSGGGFSRVVTPAPEWQKDAITTFYSEETNPPPKTAYGYGGRGTPDVAALGEGFQVIIDGRAESVGGTSAAAPTFAAVVSLLNDKRISAGKKPLGLLNQAIYQNTASFRDVTIGSDRVSRQGTPVKDGFDCEKGWDPVTGWGTPNVRELAKTMG